MSWRRKSAPYQRSFKPKPSCKRCGSFNHWTTNCPTGPRKPCKHCGSTDHPSIGCYYRPEKAALKPESSQTKAKRIATSQAWFEHNPPDENGQWECYLQIAPDCLKVVNRTTINLEHVVPKIKAPELKFEVSNIRAACQLCNKLKGGLTLEEISGMNWKAVDRERLARVLAELET